MLIHWALLGRLGEHLNLDETPLQLIINSNLSTSGGNREDAGRPARVPNKVPIGQGSRLAELAKSDYDIVFITLVAVATHGSSEAARMAAINSILNRSYGKRENHPVGLVELPANVIQ
ncbi:MAG: hypothetical protein HON25_03310 [Gammaproteobacteria bacterium]|nr:hypothetical protein [Gammaproteobacteria bacterium]